MSEVDEIEEAAALAEAETGVRGSGSQLRLCRTPGKQLARRWTADEDAYIRAQYGRITEDEIAAQLGRTLSAVHIRVTRELRLVAPSKAPDILTAEQVGWGFGMDSKSIHRLMDSGLMPHRLTPGGDRTRIIDRAVLLRWMVEPMHWIYFKPERVGALRSRGNRELSDCYDFRFWEDARELVTKARLAWPDEWLTPGQVATELSARDSHCINRAIHAGNLKATKWGNWRILRSNLPPKGMTINVLGRIVDPGAIGRPTCRVCGAIGHNKRTHAKRPAA